jgi:4-hydroxybenzoate polyprenyltransferase
MTMAMTDMLNEADEFAQARQQERQARWMSVACFLVVFVAALWIQ